MNHIFKLLLKQTEYFLLLEGAATVSMVIHVLSPVVLIRTSSL